MTGWGGYTRRTQLPPDWDARRAAVRARAGGQCEALITHLDTTGLVRCPDPGTECHHAGDRDDHNLTSLQWLCTECHALITHQQAADARRALQAKRLHPTRRSPGLID